MGWYWEGNLWLKYWVLHWCNLKCRNAMTLIKTMLDFKLAKMPCFSPDFKPGFTQPNEVISLPNLVWRYFIMLGTNFMFWSKSRLHHRTFIFEVENWCAKLFGGHRELHGSDHGRGPSRGDFPRFIFQPFLSYLIQNVIFQP